MWGFRQLGGSINHTLESISAVNKIQTLIEQVETSARGRALRSSLRKSDVELQTRAELEAAYAQLAEHVAANPTQRARIEEARSLEARRSAELDRDADSRGTFADCETLKGLRRLHQDFEDEERRLLSVTQASSDRLALAAALFMSLGFLLAAYFTLTGQAWIRNKASEWKTAREQAVEVARIKSDFLAFMSHEIRAPMAGVIGMCDLLLRSRLEGEQAGHVCTIKTTAESLLGLTNQVLDHAKIENGHLEINRDNFEPRAVLGSVLNLFKVQARNKGLDLDALVDDDVPRILRGDAGRLRQVLVNLVSNAVKFTSAGRVSVRMAIHDGELHVEVEDTGPGIPETTQSRLFQKFSQVKPSQGGAGLGLLISKGLVEAMGGDIGVDSREGFGSRFWFSAKTTNGDVVAPRPPSQSKGHVLLAEDHPINQIIIRKYLESFGLTCSVVGSGKAAVDAVKREQFDLVLMDCQMPVMDGFAATWLIRGTQATSRLPIVALTASDSLSDRERCEAVGMNDYLTKPVEVERLRAVVDRYLAGRSIAEFNSENLARLRGFKSDGRPLIAVLREDLAVDGERTIGKMEDALQNFDLGRVSELAHGLKSSGRALGLAWFGSLCEEIEHAPTLERARIDELRAALERGKDWLSGAEV